MFRKIIWVMMLLVMTACTILFKDGVAIVLGDLTPTAVSGEVVTPEVEEVIATEEVLATPEPPPTVTAPLEPTPTSVPTAAPTATPTAFDVTYVLQPGSPVYLDNFAHPAEGCNWQGVAGQVFDAQGQPVMNLIVKVNGTWNESEVARIGVTGMVTGLPYGPGSYEIVLGNKAVVSKTPLMLQIFNQDQEPLTEPFSITTKANCTKNLLILNFVIK